MKGRRRTPWGGGDQFDQPAWSTDLINLIDNLARQTQMMQVKRMSRFAV